MMDLILIKFYGSRPFLKKSNNIVSSNKIIKKQNKIYKT